MNPESFIFDRENIAVTLPANTFQATVMIDGNAMRVDQRVTWSIGGNTSAGTAINPTTGAITIAANETAPVITVRAASVARPALSGTAQLYVRIPAINITMRKTSGQVGEPFALDDEDNAGFAPPNAIPAVSDILWQIVGGTAPGAVLTDMNEVLVAGEGTVIVEGTVPAGVNRGQERRTRLTLTFSRGIISASLHGLDELYVGVPVEGEIRFALADAVFASALNNHDFNVTGLMQGLSAGAPHRVSDTLVIVPVTGTPLAANTASTVISVPQILAARNIFMGTQPVPVRPHTFTLPHVYPGAGLGVPGNVTFDLNPVAALHRDIQIQLHTADWDLRDIMYRNYRLMEGIDFTRMENNIFRIHTGFLGRLAEGRWPLTFNMQRGNNPQFTVNIIDTRILPGQQPVPGNEPDRGLLHPPHFNDQLIFIGGAFPVRADSLGLASGRGVLRPVMQNGRASIQIRADVLEYLAMQYPFSVLEAQTRLGTFRFPTYFLDILRGAKAAIALETLLYDEVYVRITLTDVSADALKRTQVQQIFPGGYALSPITDITVELVRRSDMRAFFTVREFLRPVEWVQSIMPMTNIIRYGAFWFNETPQRLEFVPHNSGGPNEVIIRTIFTGTHAVVNNGAALNDVPFAHWGFSAAFVTAQIGLVQVVGGNLSPEAPMTRAEFVQLLSFALQLGAPGFLPDFYWDIHPGHWALDAIQRARYAGLLDGDEFFRPDEPIQRGEAITMIAAAIDRGKPVRAPQHRPLSMFFTDHLTIPAHQRRAVQTALDYGIFIGLPDAAMGPYNTATRIQSLSMIIELARVLGNLDE
jgi:hypothetical protein